MACMCAGRCGAFHPSTTFHPPSAFHFHAPTREGEEEQEPPMKIAGAAVVNAISFSLASLAISFFYSCSLGIFTFSSGDAINDDAARRRLSSVPSTDDPGAYDYLIIHYHKTGHDLAYSLTKRIAKDSRTGVSVKYNPVPNRDHDEMTKCPHLELKLGRVYVQAAPDFFCDVNILAEELLHGNSKKRGIKIIHLVRNPFKLAVSHYKYHSQARTPEAWVRQFDVCAEQETTDRHYPDLLMPTLGFNGIMKYEDFDSILNLCHSLFTTFPGLEKPDFYEHLLKLDPSKGLELATSQLMRGRNGDITRMTNNIIKLQQLQELESQARIAQHRLDSERRIQVLTLTTDSFNERPKNTAMRFIQFLLGNSIPLEVKESLAAEYGEEYLSKRKDGNMHITKGGNDNSMMEDFLREHYLFGRIFENIEQVVEIAVMQSKEVKM